MYQVLARKYRPKNFHELLGQTHVSTAIINGIEQQRLHHAYLFTGTRGVGKTTIARILAKCLNCETGISSEPCGVCSTCQAVDAGRFIDLIEIDAASRTKVEDTRELLDNVPYAPTQGRYKVYLIDEVHMLSTHSFNALLKTLEEPPAHVKFLLATTDPQKLPITIISRCLQFVLRPIPQTQLADYLGTILQKESIAFQSDALWQLASSARGSVRDALSLTDQAIAFGNGQIEPATVKNMLGLIDQADVVGLLLAIVQQQKPQIAQYIQQLREQVVDAKAVFDSLADVLHHMALLQVLPDFDLQLNSEQTQARQQLALAIPSDLLQLYYEIVVQSRENIGLANTPLQALEMCILRLLAFRPLPANQIVAGQPPAPQSTFAPVEHHAASQLPNLPNTELPSLSSETLNIENLNSEHLNLEMGTVQNLVWQKPTVTNLPSETLEMPNSSETLQEATVASPLSENAMSLQAISQNFIVQNPDSQPQTTETLPLVDVATKNLANVSLDTHVNIHTENATELSLEMSQNDDGYVDKVPQDTLIQQHNSVLENLANSPTVAQANTVAQAKSVQNTLVPSEPIIEPTLRGEISPLTLLEPEVQDLTGQWTPQKWDYWVYQARENHWLTGDELSFVKQGVMVGDTAGQSYFISSPSWMNKDGTAQGRTFEDLCHKLSAHFPHMQVALHNSHNLQNLLGTNNPNITDMLQQVDLATDSPDSQQSLRHQKALKCAEQKISQEPVILALLGENASLHNLELTK